MRRIGCHWPAVAGLIVSKVNKRRIIEWCACVLLALPVGLFACILVGILQQRELARMQRNANVANALSEKLEDYRAANGRYPGSLRELATTNSSEKVQMQSASAAMTYRLTKSGYELEYPGYITISVSLPDK